MLEKDIENLIAHYPDEFFSNSCFKLIGQQVKLGSCFADILFEDKYNRTIIVEVKRGILSREASGQIIEYYGLIKQQKSDKIIELILCANIIPLERKVFLENVGIECKELGILLISNIAKKYNYKFLDEAKDKGSKIIQKKQISFEKHKIAEETIKVWIFQANPNRYDICNALSDETLDKNSWYVAKHKDKIKEGDMVLIWMSGKEAGIYAVAEIMSNPSLMFDTPESEKYWVNEKDRGRELIRVKIRIIKKLLNNPVFRQELRNIEGLKNLSIFKFSQGTNFPVREEEWKIIKQQIEKR